MANASVATGDGKTNSTDATRNAIAQLAIAITAATNMECDINRFVGVDGGRQDDTWIGWNPSGKGYKGGSATIVINDRDPVQVLD